MPGERILIADDNRQIRMLVAASLRAGGYDLLEAEDGEAALETAIAELPDLILLDVNMPKLDGFEVLHFLRSREDTVGTKVIMLTTAGTAADIQHGAQESVLGYIIKPFDPVTLKNAVTKVLEA
jgi:DNA-binding response OmpR family regulator